MKMPHSPRRAFAPLRLNSTLGKVIFPILYALFLNFLSAQAQQEDIKDEILKEINARRAEGCTCGEEKMNAAGPLLWNEKLEKAAVRHVKDIYDHEHFSHIGTDGSKLKDRVDDTGYKWSTIGENISFGYTTVPDVVKGWLNSEGHCRNIMNPAFTEMGAANLDSYWVLDLGSR